MPIFEYKCDACGTKFEKLLRRAEDRSQLSCPDCASEALSQQYSTFAARAEGAAPDMPSCPGGMCANPGFCGRN